MVGRALTDAVFATSRPRVVAALLRSFRDVDMAEDLYQEACLRAAEKWTVDGIPGDPTGWLIRVGRNAGIDQIRRRKRLVSVDAEAALEKQSAANDHEAAIAEAMDRAEYKDDILRLLFMCCHPGLARPDQLALALKVVVGFSVPEIARAFVVSADAMEQRITRAKRRAADVATRLETPSLAERTARLNAVTTMVYLLFNEGYSAGTGDQHIREALCEEAIRLSRLLLEAFPAQGEVAGLLALCLLQHSRRRARLDAAGRLVTLDRQDRSLWESEPIAEGLVLVEKALRKGRPGPLQIQAAIAAVHCSSGSAEATDWAEIDRLYAALEAVLPSPVVTLNRSVAVSKVAGPRAALDMIVPLDRPLARYQPFHSTRAAYLEACGALEAAAGAYRMAISLAPTDAEKTYLAEKLAATEERIALACRIG